MERTGYMNAPEGTMVSRYIKALALGKGEPFLAVQEAEKIYGPTSAPVAMLKTAVAAQQTSDVAASLALARGLFESYLPLLRARTLCDRIVGFRRVPQNVSVLRFSGDVSGAIVAEGSSVPVTKFSLERITLGMQKIAACTVVTNENLQDTSQQGEANLATELSKAVGRATDRAMFSLDVSTSIASAGTSIASAGSSLANIDSDIQKLLALFQDGDAALDDAVFITSPRTAAYLASLRGTGGARAFPDVNLRTGGNLIGIPLFISAALEEVGSPDESQLTLVDPSQVLLSDPNVVEIQTSQNASLQMDDAANDSSTVPTASSLVSLFQTNTTAILGVRYVNWLLSKSTACATLSGVTY